MARYRPFTRRRPRRRTRHRTRADAAPIQARRLLTPAELAFFRVLKQCLKSGLALSLKTRLADVVDCPDSLWLQPFGRRIAQKHVDFTVYDPATGAILAAIELDDRSHDSPARRRRDLFLDQLFDQIEVPLLRVRCAACYDRATLAMQIEAAVNQPSHRNVNQDRPIARSS